MNELWIVRFVRKDGKPDEEYYYHSLAEAEYHRNLFLNDDSGLYKNIEIVRKNSKEVTMEMGFIKCGDYYIPDIKLSKPNICLGKWGRMRREYLRLAHPITFTDMVLSETLYSHCAEIEAIAKKRMSIIVPKLMLQGAVRLLPSSQDMEAAIRTKAAGGRMASSVRGSPAKRKPYRISAGCSSVRHSR